MVKMYVAYFEGLYENEMSESGHMLVKLSIVGPAMAALVSGL